MNTNLNDQEYPRLTPPDVVYEHKASLKKTLVIPMYVKITVAAAVVALLFGIFWPRSVRHEMELVAELKPVMAMRVEMEEPVFLTKRTAHIIVPKTTVTPDDGQEEEFKRAELPLIAELPSKTAALPVAQPDLPFMTISDDGYDLAANDPVLSEEDDEMSIVARGIQKLTDGKCHSFFGMVSQGWRTAKTELAMAKEQSFSLPLQKIRDYDFELHHMER